MDVEMMPVPQLPRASTARVRTSVSPRTPYDRFPLPFMSLAATLGRSDETLELTASGIETGYAVSDGRQRTELDPPETVTVSRSDRPLRLAGPDVDFFETLGKLE